MQFSAGRPRGGERAAPGSCADSGGARKHAALNVVSLCNAQTAAHILIGSASVVVLGVQIYKGENCKKTPLRSGL